jgi:hypothetical protein
MFAFLDNTAAAFTGPMNSIFTPSHVAIPVNSDIKGTSNVLQKIDKLQAEKNKDNSQEIERLLTETCHNLYGVLLFKKNKITKEEKKEVYLLIGNILQQYAQITLKKSLRNGEIAHQMYLASLNAQLYGLGIHDEPCFEKKIREYFDRNIIFPTELEDPIQKTQNDSMLTTLLTYDTDALLATLNSYFHHKECFILAKTFRLQLECYELLYTAKNDDFPKLLFFATHLASRLLKLIPGEDFELAARVQTEVRDLHQALLILSNKIQPKSSEKTVLENYKKQKENVLIAVSRSLYDHFLEVESTEEKIKFHRFLGDIFRQYGQMIFDTQCCDDFEVISHQFYLISLDIQLNGLENGELCAFFTQTLPRHLQNNTLSNLNLTNPIPLYLPMHKAIFSKGLYSFFDRKKFGYENEFILKNTLYLLLQSFQRLSQKTTSNDEIAIICERYNKEQQIPEGNEAIGKINELNNELLKIRQNHGSPKSKQSALLKLYLDFHSLMVKNEDAKNLTRRIYVYIGEILFRYQELEEQQSSCFSQALQLASLNALLFGLGVAHQSLNTKFQTFIQFTLEKKQEAQGKQASYFFKDDENNNTRLMEKVSELDSQNLLSTMRGCFSHQRLLMIQLLLALYQSYLKMPKHTNLTRDRQFLDNINGGTGIQTSGKIRKQEISSKLINLTLDILAIKIINESPEIDSSIIWGAHRKLLETADQLLPYTDDYFANKEQILTHICNSLFRYQPLEDSKNCEWNSLLGEVFRQYGKMIVDHHPSPLKVVKRPNDWMPYENTGNFSPDLLNVGYLLLLGSLNAQWSGFGLATLDRFYKGIPTFLQERLARKPERIREMAKTSPLDYGFLCNLKEIGEGKEFSSMETALFNLYPFESTLLTEETSMLMDVDEKGKEKELEFPDISKTSLYENLEQHVQKVLGSGVSEDGIFILAQTLRSLMSSCTIFLTQMKDDREENIHSKKKGIHYLTILFHLSKLFLDQIPNHPKTRHEKWTLETENMSELRLFLKTYASKKQKQLFKETLLAAVAAKVVHTSPSRLASAYLQEGVRTNDDRSKKQFYKAAKGIKSSPETIVHAYATLATLSLGNPELWKKRMEKAKLWFKVSQQNQSHKKSIDLELTKSLLVANYMNKIYKDKELEEFIPEFEEIIQIDPSQIKSLVDVLMFKANKAQEKNLINQMFKYYTEALQYAERDRDKHFHENMIQEIISNSLAFAKNAKTPSETMAYYNFICNFSPTPTMIEKIFSQLKERIHLELRQTNQGHANFYYQAAMNWDIKNKKRLLVRAFKKGKDDLKKTFTKENTEK